MDETRELLELMKKLDKKVDKLTNIVTKIAKTLHLIPVTEKEERDIQLLQRKNLALAAKVSEDLDEMSPKDESHSDVSIQSLYSNGLEDIFGDVVADDYLTGGV